MSIKLLRVNLENFIMKKLLLLTCFLSPSFFCFSADNYTIYLVRHAEKQSDVKNPSLIPCGKARAKLLANFLSKTNIKNIYSTSYQRTMQTAQPFASQENIVIKNYSPKHLQQFALQLKQKKESSLVVGHSNTTPQLVEFLTNEEVAPLTEYDYQYLYQVQFVNEQPVLTVFQQPLTCKEK